MKGVITINTDAGFYPIEKIGSYAYWIKGDDIFLRGSGVFKNTCESPLDAEMKSIINAVEVLTRSNYTQIKKLIINRDNIYAKAKRNGNPLQSMLHKKVRLLMKKCSFDGTIDMFLEIRHVKAHTNKTDARSWVNNWCDQKCKEELRKHKYLMKKAQDEQ